MLEGCDEAEVAMKKSQTEEEDSSALDEEIHVDVWIK